MGICCSSSPIKPLDMHKGTYNIITEIDRNSNTRLKDHTSKANDSLQSFQFSTRKTESKPLMVERTYKTNVNSDYNPLSSEPTSDKVIKDNKKANSIVNIKNQTKYNNSKCKQRQLQDSTVTNLSKRTLKLQDPSIITTQNSNLHYIEPIERGMTRNDSNESIYKSTNQQVFYEEIDIKEYLKEIEQFNRHTLKRVNQSNSKTLPLFIVPKCVSVNESHLYNSLKENSSIHQEFFKYSIISFLTQINSTS